MSNKTFPSTLSPIDAAMLAAQQEIDKERQTKNVGLFKFKLKQIEDTKVILKNLEREMEALKDEMENGL